MGQTSGAARTPQKLQILWLGSYLSLLSFSPILEDNPTWATSTQRQIQGLSLVPPFAVCKTSPRFQLSTFQYTKWTMALLWALKIESLKVGVQKTKLSSFSMDLTSSNVCLYVIFRCACTSCAYTNWRRVLQQRTTWFAWHYLLERPFLSRGPALGRTSIVYSRKGYRDPQGRTQFAWSRRSHHWYVPLSLFIHLF